MPGPQPLETVILREKEYWPLYEKAFEKPAYTAAFTEKAHLTEFKRLDRALRKALSTKWEEDSCMEGDFAMMDEGEAFRAF